MAQKDIDTLRQEIDAAVHPGGGPPLIMGADLNAVLTSLATEVVGAGGPVRIADYNAIRNALENESADTEQPTAHEFAVGDVVGQSGQGLFQCVQAFTLRYDFDVEFSNNHFPLSSPTYWRPIVQSSSGSGGSGDGQFVRLDDDNYKVARPGESVSAIVANAAWYHFATGLGSTVVGGNRNTVAATFGTVVGGQGNTLPEGAESSVILGGNDFMAPGRPNTVFAPNLVLWENGSTLELTDNSGKAHELAVNEAGGLLIDGRAVVPAAASSLTILDSAYTAHTLTVNELGSLLIDGQPATTPLISYTLTGGGDANPQTRQVTLTQLLDYQQPGSLPAPELRDGGLVVPVRGYYELTSQVTLAANSLTTSQSCGVSGGPVFDWRNIGWVSGAPVTRSLVARTSQRILLEAGTVVYLYAQFAGPAAKVDGQLGVYLLHAA